jgi:hypothetical protein
MIETLCFIKSMITIGYKLNIPMEKFNPWITITMEQIIIVVVVFPITVGKSIGLFL